MQHMKQRSFHAPDRAIARRQSDFRLGYRLIRGADGKLRLLKVGDIVRRATRS